MSRTPSDLGRLARTLVHVGPDQMWHRARLRANRAAAGRWPGRVGEHWSVERPSTVGIPAGFAAVDSTLLADRWDIDDLEKGTLDLLNDRRDLAGPQGTLAWDPADASHLWLFHHHYWEWAWSLAAHPDRERARAVFAHQWSSWTEGTSFGRWNAWAPYPASLRAWVFVNVFRPLVEGSEIEERFSIDLARHAGFVEHNLELDVGGNHVMKNLKALVGLAIFLGDRRLLEKACRQLRREVGVQVLPDGGHYELSPSYHCQVLGDLLDISNLLAAAGSPPEEEVDAAITTMRRWLGIMRAPDGGLPLFNDCEPVEPALIEALGAGPGAGRSLTVLPHSGYVVIAQGPIHLVADVGQPGPSSPPGHIHADCLSFVLYVDGHPVVVDSGTSEYGSGPRRRHERSTAAHNTVEVDGTDQTEVWGAFRAGRRARATLERAEVCDDQVVVVASHDGYRHLPGAPLHRRTFEVSTSAVSISDEVSGSGRHRVVSRVHLNGSAVDLEPGEHLGTASSPGSGPIAVEFATAADPSASGTGPEIVWHHCLLASGFGNLVPGLVASCSVEADLPIALVTDLTLATT